MLSYLFQKLEKTAHFDFQANMTSYTPIHTNNKKVACMNKK